MKLRLLVLAVISAFLLVIAVAPAQALPKRCTEICTPTSSPNLVGACGFVFEVTTCGQFPDGCGFGAFTTAIPSDIGLPNTLLTDLGIDISQAR